VRRDVAGGKRGMGWQLQAEGKRVRRADPSRIEVGKPDASLTGVSGLVPFGKFVRGLGVDWELRQLLGDVKVGPQVVYPMPEQVRLLIDANAVGEQRVFGLEALAADPLFVRLAGGGIPSLDTVYRDLCRLDEPLLGGLHALMSRLGSADLHSMSAVHLDIDTTVEPVFGHQQGALLGYNPRYPGRLSYHPILAVIAETKLCIGAELRPGDRALGDEDAKTIGRYVRSVRAKVARNAVLTVRMDSGADCSAILRAIDNAGAFFVVKLKLTPELLGGMLTTTQWRTVDVDADGRPLRQVAELSFRRDGWTNAGKAFRVIATRYRDRDTGKQVQLWPDLDYCVQAFVTNNWQFDAGDIVADYDGRAEIEPLIAELKNGVGIGKVPSQDFNANHASFLIKLITHNLMRRFVASVAPALRSWRMPWLWRVLMRVPGRLIRSGRRWTLRVPPGSLLCSLQC
jgi:Transposase DDE domain group 1